MKVKTNNLQQTCNTVVYNIPTLFQQLVVGCSYTVASNKVLNVSFARQFIACIEKLFLLNYKGSNCNIRFFLSRYSIVNLISLLTSYCKVMSIKLLLVWHIHVRQKMTKTALVCARVRHD